MAKMREDATTSDDVKRGKGYTPPKGRPTRHRDGTVRRSRLSPTMEWVIAIIVMLVVLGAIMYFFADIGGGGAGLNGLGTVDLAAAHVGVG